MVQARALVIKLYYIPWKTVVFASAKDQPSGLVYRLPDGPLSSKNKKMVAFKETICLNRSVQKDLGSMQICRDWTWSEQLTERKKETFLSKGSKWKGGPRTAGQLLLLLNFFIHSTKILLWSFFVVDTKDTTGRNLEMVPASIVLLFSQMYLLDSQGCTGEIFLLFVKHFTTY